MICGWLTSLPQFEDEYKADAVFIDQGYGTGIYSIGKSMGRRWRLVAFGGKAPNGRYCIYQFRTLGR